MSVRPLGVTTLLLSCQSLCLSFENLQDLEHKYSLFKLSKTHAPVASKLKYMSISVVRGFSSLDGKIEAIHRGNLEAISAAHKGLQGNHMLQMTYKSLTPRTMVDSSGMLSRVFIVNTSMGHQEAGNKSHGSKCSDLALTLA